jgi:hypothetical protein
VLTTLALRTTKRSFTPHCEQLEVRDVPAGAVGNSLLWQNYTQAQAFSLHSLPGASKVIYLDFDGGNISGTQWNTDANGGNPFTMQAWSMDANRAAFSGTERDAIIRMWRKAAEDFVPFGIDVTTEAPAAGALTYSGGADTTWGMHVYIGPVPTTSNAAFWQFPGPPPTPVGGIAYFNTFRSAVDVGCFVFNGDLSPFPDDSLPDTISHEVGHTLGLSHDGTAAQQYYPGHGTGITSWGPIMGGPFGMTLTQWSRNTYPGANNAEDDLAIITGGVNGVSYSPDDTGSTITASNRNLNAPRTTTLTTTYGVIEQNTDSDYYRIYAGAGTLTVTVDPLTIGPNLDVQLQLYNAAGTLIASANPAATISATISTNITASGSYYLRVFNAGLAAAPGNPGYTTYGSIGSYRINGTVAAFIPVIDQVKSLNPVRWDYNSRTGIYSGYITFTNTSNTAQTGPFTITMVVPSSVTILTPTGTRSGNNYSFTYNGNFPVGSSIRVFVQLLNPLRVSLGTGFTTFVQGIV